MAAWIEMDRIGYKQIHCCAEDSRVQVSTKGPNAEKPLKEYTPISRKMKIRVENLFDLEKKTFISDIYSRMENSFLSLDPVDKERVNAYWIADARKIGKNYYLVCGFGHAVF